MYKRHWTFFIYSTLLAVTLPFTNQAYGQLNGDASTNNESFSYWIDHLPYNSISHIAHLDGLTFCGADQGLLVYDNAAGEYQRFSSINGLSDAGITAIAADASSSSVWMGYPSGRIDVWYNGKFHAINAIEDAPQYTGLKTINAITFYGDKAYVATDFGIVEFSTLNYLAERTFILGPNSTATRVDNMAITDAGVLYALTPQMKDEGLINKGVLTDNLVFYENWTPLGLTQNWNGTALVFDPVQSALLFAKEGDMDTELLRLDTDSTTSILYTTAQTLQSLTVSSGGEMVVATLEFNVLLFENGMNTTNISAAIFNTGAFSPLCAVHDDEDQATLIGNYKTGLIRTKDLVQNKRIVPNSPYSDRAYQLVSFGAGRNTSYTDVGGNNSENFGGVLLCPGALTDLWTKTFVADGMGVYSGQRWTHKPNALLYGVTDVVDAAYTVNSAGEAQLFLSSWGKGLVLIQGNGSPEFLMDTVALFNTANSDGALVGVGGNASDLRTGGIALDENGTLWGVQSLVSNPLFSRSPEGVFTSYGLSPGADGVALKDVLVEDGMVFIQSRTNGIYAYSEVDGVGLKRQLTSGLGSGDLPSDKVLAMTFDQDGELWIGTDEGLVVLYSPENLFDGTGSYDARPILFEEDGVVQKLLGETPVTALYTDGGNQKWIGTRGAGLFLVAPDGLTLIHQFTENNSPLISNSIVDVAVDPTTGEVLIATDKGLIGFRGDATPGHTGFYPELHVYPNPVRPNYDGPVFIQGLQENARIKITDVSGGLVYESISTGGQLRWEGQNLRGLDVSSGVYLIYAMDDLGEVTAQGKVLIVR